MPSCHAYACPVHIRATFTHGEQSRTRRRRRYRPLNLSLLHLFITHPFSCRRYSPQSVSGVRLFHDLHNAACTIQPSPHLPVLAPSNAMQNNSLCGMPHRPPISVPIPPLWRFKQDLQLIRVTSFTLQDRTLAERHAWCGVHSDDSNDKTKKQQQSVIRTIHPTDAPCPLQACCYKRSKSPAR